MNMEDNILLVFDDEEGIQTLEKNISPSLRLCV